jgi:hypothetical protein
MGGERANILTADCAKVCSSSNAGNGRGTMVDVSNGMRLEPEVMLETGSAMGRGLHGSGYGSDEVVELEWSNEIDEASVG